MPYRIDIEGPAEGAMEQLIDLGALDVDGGPDRVAAILPDHVTPDGVERIAGGRIRVSAAHARDDGTVWILAPRPVRAGAIVVLPAGSPRTPGSVRLSDSAAFGTGLHPTTALCLEMLSAELSVATPARALDVGTGSGVLALAALALGVPHVTAIDTDSVALRIAAENAQLNDASGTLRLLCAGPDQLSGRWPLVLANILAAPLMEMAGALTQRVDRKGRLVLSGIPASAAGEVACAYRRAGMSLLREQTQGSWTAVLLQATW